MRCFLLVAVPLAVACADDPPRSYDSELAVVARSPARALVTATPSDSAPPTLPSGPTPAWREFRGEGFVLRYPGEATLLSRAPAGEDGIAATTIRGPTVAVRSPYEHIGTHTGPAYELTITGYPSAEVGSVDAWVDSIRQANNAQIAADDTDSLTYLTAPAIVRVGHERALRLEPFCGDCQPEEIYLAGPKRRVLVSIVYDLSIPGDREAQRRLYEAILGTFRWAP